MTAEQASKIICQRYELDLSDYEMKKMQGIIRSVATIKKKVVVLQEPQKKTLTDSGVKKIFADICRQHELDPEQVKSKCRKMELVKCRVHFVRFIYLNNYDVSLTKLGDFLNCDHSTIINMRDSAKVDCPIPPFNFKFKYKK